MKKLIFIFAIMAGMIFPASAQFNMPKQLVTADTVTADTGYVITLTADYVWGIEYSFAHKTDSTTAYYLQYSIGGTYYVNHPDYSSGDTMTGSATGRKIYRGDYNPAYKYRVYIDVDAGDTIISNLYYLLRKKN